MEQHWRARPFGSTGLNVSALGLGAGQIGDGSLSEDHVGELLNRAVDAGITLIDTARGYGLSEERIGRHLAHRRQDFVLSTKVGYDIPGYEDWSGSIITAGIDAALQKLRTDYLDIVHLHSCPLDVLERGEVVEALSRAVETGKVRVAAYSGDNAPLAWAVRSGRFGSIETSINICDQWSLINVLPEAHSAGLGVIAKRPVANAPWRFAERPAGHYCEVYWERLRDLDLDPGGLEWQDLALRFAAYHSGAHSAIVGTSSLTHLLDNLASIERGPLPADLAAHILQRFQERGGGWPGEV